VPRYWASWWRSTASPGCSNPDGDDPYAQAALEIGKGVLIGTENYLWASLGSGARGVTAPSRTFAPEEVVASYEKVREGDGPMAKARSRRSGPNQGA